METKSKIPILINYYLPGYKAGEPVRTITNIVDHLSDDFEFWIIAHDRDLGDTISYPDVVINKWLRVGKAWVLYASPDKLTSSRYEKKIKKKEYNVQK